MIQEFTLLDTDNSTNIHWPLKSDAFGLQLHGVAKNSPTCAHLPASKRLTLSQAEIRGLRELISWRPKKEGAFVAISHPRSAWRRARAFMAAKYGRTWRWHDLRAAFITHVAMTSGGMVAKQLARHSSFETTQGYIEVADEAQRLAAQRISGRAQQFESHQRHSPTAAFLPTPGKRKVLK